MKSNLILCILLLLGTLNAHATLFINNLETENQLDGFSIGASGMINVSSAAGFTTSDTDAVLNSVTLSLNTTVNNSEALSISIFDDVSGDPGSLVANGTLSGISNPITSGNYTYSTTGLVTLSSNTTYWIVAQSTNPGSYLWNYNQLAYTVTDWTDAGTRENINSGSWNEYDEFNMKYSVDATAVPEPASYATILGVLFFVFKITRRRKV